MAAPNAKYRILGLEHAAFQKRVGVTATMIEHDIHFINNVAFDVTTSDVSFEGDNTSVRKFFLTGVGITAVADTYDLKAICEAFGKDEVTTGLPVGIDGRVYFGDSVETAGVRCGFLSQVLAENLISNAVETLNIVAPMCVLTIVRPPSLAFNTKGQLNMQLTAEKTTLDIAQVALPGVPPGGAFWYIDRIVA